MSNIQQETMSKTLEHRDILYNQQQLGPYPTHLLKRVDRPTNKIVGPIERRDPRESVFGRSARGDYGDKIQSEFLQMTVRYPVGAALVDLQHHINTYALRGRRFPLARRQFQTIPVS